MSYRSVSRGLIAGLAVLLLTVPELVRAQVPNISETVPAESPLGEGFCFEANFTNSGVPGFGPYLRLSLPPELSLDSASLFSFGTAQLVTDLGVFPPPPGNEIEDPLIEAPVSGVPGNRLFLIVLPVGGVVDGGPDLPVEICTTIDTSAEFNVPLPIELTPVYRFGDTPTGVNGPVVGTPVVQSVSPQVLFFTKTSGVPEGERPPGPLWSYDYTLDVDIANGAGISPIVISDTLAPDFQFDGSLAINGAGTCSATQLPSTTSPGGVLEVTCTNVPVGSSAANEISVVYGGFITDILDAGSCAASNILNTAGASGSYQPPSGAAIPVTSLPDTVVVSAQHLTIQQGVSPGTPLLGATLEYRSDLQVTEFASPSALLVTTILPDGIDYLQEAALTINGATVAITPTITLNADFSTTVVHDIAAAAAAAGVALPAGSTITLTFEGTVRFTYQATGAPILAGDSLTATTAATYDLGGGANDCTNGSSATVNIEPVDITKTLINPQPVYRPGDAAVFRLTKRVSAGSTSNIRFADFLPLPALRVTDLDLTFGTGDITRGPDDTAGLVPTSIVANSSLNAVEIAWPDLSSTTSRVIQIDIRATITSEPFADGLFLTNIFAAQSNNTSAQTNFGVDVDALNIGAPELVVTKGVASTNGAGVITPAPTILPVDGDLAGADGNDTVDFVITVENTGNAPAHDVTITDPGAPLLSACSLTSLQDGLGNDLAFSGALAGGLQLTAPLAESDGAPGAPYGADTALATVRCAVSATIPPNSAFDNTATVTWTSQPGAPAFPPITDSAAVSSASTSLEKLFVVSSEPGTSDTQNPPRATIGEIVRYRLALAMPEGRITGLRFIDRFPGTLQFLDDGTATAAFVSNGAGLSSSTLPIPNVNGSGVDLASLPSSALTFALPAGAISGGPFNPGTDPVFNLGDVTNSDSDLDAEYVVIEVNAVVVNVNGNNRDNRFAAFSGNSDLNGNSNAVRVRLAEPRLTVQKTALPTTGDAGDPIAYTIVVSNAGGANTSPGYDVTLGDLLPAGLAGATNISAGAANGNCTNLVITDNTVGDNLQFAFNEIRPDCRIEITFDAALTNAVSPGTSVDNTAELAWTSLPGSNGTTGNPTGSVTPGVPGAVNGERDDSGGVNDYLAEATAPVSIPGVGLVKRVTSTDQPSSGVAEHRPGVTDLLIGEVATFEVIATLPEGQTPQLVIRDTLPFTNGVMRLDSARLVRIGSQLAPGIPAPVPQIDDLQLGDGIDDTVSFDFGAVTNTPDGVTDAEDEVVIEVTATLVDVAANVNADALANTALVQFGSGLNASATAPLDVIEPVLGVVKTGSISQGDAGDRVLYTVTLSHTASSTAIAQDLTLADDLPPELALDLASIVVTSGPNFDVNLSSGDSVALGWTALPLGTTIEVQYEANLRDSVMPGESIVNTANVEWTSIPGDNADERTNTDDDSHTILITPPGVSKAVVATSEPGTGDGAFGPADDLTIGERVTYRFTVSVPEGTSVNSRVVDQLPTGSSVLGVVSSSLVSIGSQLSGPGLPAPGTAGVPTDTDLDGVDDRVTWDLGDILNSPDDVSNADDLLTFEVVAVLLDLPQNQSGVTDQLNVATASSDTASGSSSAPIDIVAPALRLTKNVLSPVDGFVDGGDTVSMRLRLAPLAASTADAYTLVVEDTLPAGLNWVSDAGVGGDCPGLTVDSSAEPLIRFEFDELRLADAACDITYDVEVDPTVQPGQELENVALLTFDSTPVFVAGETRQGTSSAVAEVVVFAPSLIKVAVDTSQPGTSLEQGDPTLLDLTIGETVTYELTLSLPEVLVTNVVLTDTLPAGAGGYLEAVGASVLSVGSQISTTLPGTPVLTDDQLGDGINDTVTLNFGDISNLPDGIESDGDQIRVQIVARVIDLPENTDGVVLTNSAVVTSDTGDLSDTADVEVVEPATNLSKTMTLLADGLVRISLQVENTGTAPVYDLQVNDVLSEADWNLATFVPVSVPSGFELLTLPDTPAPGEQTIRFQSDPGAVQPAGTIPVGSTVVATFDVLLAVLPPQPNPLPNEATQDAADSLPGPDSNARDLPTDSATDDVALPDLVLDKTASLLTDADGSGNVSPGDTLRYTLVMSNQGVADATNVLLQDAPDSNSDLVVGSVVTSLGSVAIGNTAGDTTVEVVLGTLIAGGQATVTYDTTLPAILPSGVDTVVNQATFDSDELPPALSDDPNDPTGAQDPTVVPIFAQPDLVLGKDDGNVTTQPGGTVVWTLSFENVGNQAATGVVLFETVPANTTFLAGASSVGWACVPNTQAGALCLLSLGEVPAGDSGTATFAVAVDAVLPSGVSEIVNTARIADDGTNGADPTPDNNQATDVTPVTASPDLVITKDDGGISVSPGQVLPWTLQVLNVGNQEATGVVVSDTVPANSVFDAAASTAGWSCVPGGTPGGVCTLSLGDLQVGEDDTVVFAVRVDNPVIAGVEEIQNTASVQDDGTNGPDPTPGNNQATDQTPVDAAPDLAITKDDGGATAVPGQGLPWTLQVANVGNQGATGVVVTDAVPANATFDAAASTPGWACVPGIAPGSVCTLALGGLDAGQTTTVTFAVIVDTPVPAGVDELLNTASVQDDGANGPDPTPDNNMAMDQTPVDATPDLAIIKNDGGVTAVPGQVLPWTLQVSNVGVQGATGVVVTDTVPANTTFDAASSTPGWVCVPNAAPGSICTLSLGALAAGQNASVDFAVVVDAPLAAGVGEIANTATVQDDGANGPDPTPDNNMAMDLTPVDATPDLAITKDDGGLTAIPGEVLSWTLQVSNVGAQGATGVVVTDTVPANTSFDAGASSPGWACVPDAAPGSVCTLALGALAGGQGSSLTFAVRVDNPLPAGVQEIANTASVADDGANGPDPTPDNNVATDLTPVAADIDVAITKTDGGQVAEPAQILVYTLTYNNLGTQGVTGVVVEETVPLNTRFAAGSSTAGWSCAPDAVPGTVCRFDVGGLASGDSGTLLFAVTLDEILPETVTEISNTVTIEDDGANGPDENPDNNASTALTPADVSVRLELTKNLSAAPDPIGVGALLEYTLVATNSGNTVLTNVVVSDSLITPTGGSTPCARLMPGDTCDLVGTYTVTQADVDRGRIDNTGTATSDQDGPRQASLTVPLMQSAALSLVKTALLRDDNGNGLGDQGERVDYELVATNVGDTTLTDVLIEDPLLPALSCQPAQPAVLAPGAALTCSGTYTVTLNDLSRRTLENRAVVNGRTPDGSTITDDATASVPLKPFIARAVPVLGLPGLLLMIFMMAAFAAPAVRRREARR
ncbi:MAG: hypothetical protein V2I57_09740 [Xanthomonadales bacterium]|nr:hypothetical protein [Xanthomonadales bacterium]